MEVMNSLHSCQNICKQKFCKQKLRMSLLLHQNIIHKHKEKEVIIDGGEVSDCDCELFCKNSISEIEAVLTMILTILTMIA